MPTKIPTTSEAKTPPAPVRIRVTRKADTAVTPPAPPPKFVWLPIGDIKPAARKVRKHPKGQLEKLIANINRFQVITELLIDGQHRLIDGHLLWEALRTLGHSMVRCQVVDHLSEAEIDTLRVAQHALMEMSQWDDEGLQVTVEGLFKIDPLLIQQTLLPMAKIDGLMISGFKAAKAEPPPPPPKKVSLLRVGDSFIPTPKKGTPVHRLLGGDAKDPAVIARALGGQPLRMVLADMPYGLVPIKGVVSDRHEDFVEGAGLNEPETLVLFNGLLAPSVSHLMDGGAAFLFMDHRGMFALTQATRNQGLTHICTAVFDKEAGGMGGLYRHQVEFCLVLAKGERIEINNVQLGKWGRNRTTLWRSRGMAHFGADRDAALEAHPTVKPVQVCAEAILDVSNIGDVVLDPTMGSGTTIVAAHRVNRVGVGVELDPVYLEVAVRRLQEVTGAPMIHEETGLTLDALIAERSAQADAQG